MTSNEGTVEASDTQLGSEERESDRAVVGRRLAAMFRGRGRDFVLAFLEVVDQAVAIDKERDGILEKLALATQQAHASDKKVYALEGDQSKHVRELSRAKVRIMELERVVKRLQGVSDVRANALERLIGFVSCWVATSRGAGDARWVHERAAELAETLRECLLGGAVTDEVLEALLFKGKQDLDMEGFRPATAEELDGLPPGRIERWRGEIVLDVPSIDFGV